MSGLGQGGNTNWTFFGKCTWEKHREKFEYWVHFLSNFFTSFFIFYFPLLLEVELRITKKLCQGWVRVVIQIGLFLENVPGKNIGKNLNTGSTFCPIFLPVFSFFIFHFYWR